MPRSKAKPPPSEIGGRRPYLIREFGIAHAFFMDSWWQMEAVLPSIDANEAVPTGEDGRPLAADKVMRRLKQMSADQMARLAASSCVSMTCLGYSMEHALMLLLQLTAADKRLTRQPHLVSRLYAALPSSVRRELEDLYGKAGYQDIEFEEQFGEPGPWPASPERGPGLANAMARWDEGHHLQPSHYKYSMGTQSHAVVQFIIPYMTLRFVDAVLSSAVAPRLGVSRPPVFPREQPEVTHPKVEWKDDMLFVTLPDQTYGRTLEAKWKPGITTVVRIREAGTEDWSVGFETPLNACSFADLKPDTRYEIMIAHKNEAGEGAPLVKEFRTEKESAP